MKHPTFLQFETHDRDMVIIEIIFCVVVMVIYTIWGPGPL